MKTTIVRNLPDELHKKLKVLAAQQGRPLQDLIVDLLAEAMKKAGKP